MRRIACWDDLRPWGIDALTGEACGLAMRLLCDVTAEGKRAIERFLGGTVEVRRDSNWNGGSKDDPHVGSVLLPRSILPDLAAFLLVGFAPDPGLCVATLEDGTVAELSLEYLERYSKLDMIKRVWRRSTDPGTGDRNQHAATLRIE